MAKIYEKEKTIKFLDVLIEDIETVEYFNIKAHINKYKDIDEHEKRYLPHSIAELGKTYGLFEKTLDSDEWFKLTPKGIELKEYGKGFNNFENKLKRKITYFEKLSILFFIITFLFGVYQYKSNDTLENRILHLSAKLKSDSLSIDSLKLDIHYLKNIHLKNDTINTIWKKSR